MAERRRLSSLAGAGIFPAVVTPGSRRRSGGGAWLHLAGSVLGVGTASGYFNRRLPAPQRWAAAFTAG